MHCAAPLLSKRLLEKYQLVEPVVELNIVRSDDDCLVRRRQSDELWEQGPTTGNQEPEQVTSGHITIHQAILFMGTGWSNALGDTAAKQTLRVVSKWLLSLHPMTIA